MILFSTLVIEKLFQNIKKKMATFAESQILCKPSLSEFYEGYRGGIKSTQEEVLLIINLMIVLEKKLMIGCWLVPHHIRTCLSVLRLNRKHFLSKKNPCTLFQSGPEEQ